jgi:hypothetical protein
MTLGSKLDRMLAPMGERSEPLSTDASNRLERLSGAWVSGGCCSDCHQHVNVLGTYRIGERWVASLGAPYTGRQFNQLDTSDSNGIADTGTSNFLFLSPACTTA